MEDKLQDAVTGAFGYSGRYITQRLLNAGRRVVTLTNSPQRQNPFGDKVPAYPFSFDNPLRLAETLRGCDVLYNTYWVRFARGSLTHEEAVRNSRVLFAAAVQAGVRRVVHISITNPSEDSPLSYFRGKAMVERALKESGLSYCILRPAVLFGGADILINNIAWSLRRLPVMGVPAWGLLGRADYCLQPIHVQDLAELAVSCGAGSDNRIVDAIGPETFTYPMLVRTVARAIGVHRAILPTPASIVYAMGSLIGRMHNDVFLTRDELEGLMANLLCTNSPPAGKIKLSEWAAAHAATLGRHYASETARRENRLKSYD